MNIFTTDMTQRTARSRTWKPCSCQIGWRKRMDKLLKTKNSAPRSYVTEADSGEFNRNHQHLQCIPQKE